MEEWRRGGREKGRKGEGEGGEGEGRERGRGEWKSHKKRFLNENKCM